MATVYAVGSNGHHRITMDVSEQSVSTADNTSTISYSLTLSPEVTGYGWDSQTNPFVCSVWIGNKILSCTLLSYDGTSTVTLLSGTLDMLHDPDGSKTIAFSFDIANGSDNPIGSCHKDGMLTLTTINRISTFSVPTGDHPLGTQMTITVTKPLSTSKHTLTYKCYGITGLIGSAKTTSTSLSWTPSTDLAAQMTIRNTMDCILTLTTYESDGTTVIGESTQTITLSIPIQLPTVDSTLVDVTPYMARLNPPPITNPFFVTLSSLKFWAGPQCYNSATLKSSTVVFRKNDSSGEILAQGVYNTVTEWPLGLWNWTGTVYMKIAATDSRGNVGEAEKTFTVYPYYFPVITTFTVGRYADSAGTTPSAGGSYCKVTYAASVTSIVDGGSERNPGTVTIRYKTRASSTWTTPVSSSTMSGSTVFPADVDTAYDVQITADDRGSYGLTKSTILSTGHFFMDWREDGTGLAFGGESTQSNALESYWPIFEQGTSLANKYNSKITKITDSSGDVSAASGSNVQCSSTAVSKAGYYMVVGYQNWTSGFTGTTTFRIIQKRGSTSQSTWSWRHDATGGGGISGVALLQIAANDTINTEVYQSSGSNKTARTYIYAFRLMD